MILAARSGAGDRPGGASVQANKAGTADTAGTAGTLLTATGVAGDSSVCKAACCWTAEAGRALQKGCMPRTEADANGDRSWVPVPSVTVKLSDLADLIVRAVVTALTTSYNDDSVRGR